jgi:hypothetical protein
VSGTEPWSMKYPPTPPDVMPGTPLVLKVLGGCLIAIVVAAVAAVVLVFIVIRMVFSPDAETRKSEHDANLLYSTFTGRAADTGTGGAPSGPAHAAGTLQGHPTPREEEAKAIQAFTATGYTPMINTTPGETACSFASYPPTAYLPGEAPISVIVNCIWRAQQSQSPYSTASIGIQGQIPTVDLGLKLDSRGYLEPNIGLVEDLPLNDVYVDVTARA